MKNKIIEVQDVLFQEMKRLNKKDFLTDENSKKELERSTAIYNQTTNFIKAVNTNIAIRNLSRWEETKYDVLIKELGLSDEEV